jgi:hypothetical protein
VTVDVALAPPTYMSISFAEDAFVVQPLTVGRVRGLLESLDVFLFMVIDDACMAMRANASRYDRVAHSVASRRLRKSLLRQEEAAKILLSDLEASSPDSLFIVERIHYASPLEIVITFGVTVYLRGASGPESSSRLQ